LLVLLVATGLMMAGLVVVNSMDVDVFPDLTAPTVTVLTEAHGMEAEEVERMVTFHIETGLNGSPNVRRIRSSSAAGVSVVWVEFQWGTEIFKARQIVSEKLPAIQEKLPEGVGDPTLAPISSIMGEVMLLGVTSDSLSPMDLRTIADWELLPRMKAIQGIANVMVIGGEFKQYQILASPLKMKYYGVSLEELLHAAGASNKNATGGFYNQHGNQYVIKGTGRVHDPDEVAGSLVKMVGGKPVTIGEVAEVRIGAADKIGDGSMNAHPAVIMTLTKQPSTNTLELTEKIDAAIKDLKASFPVGIEVNNDVFRQADFIRTSIDNLQQTLLEGTFFVIVVLFVFLMNWRTTVISLVTIPLSLLVSFIALKLLGYTINTMVLGGMAIAIGVLVDDAIIDVENVFKRLRQNALLEKNAREKTLKVVFEASKEVRGSIVIATLIVIVAFIPLFLLGGMEGRLLQPLGVAFITAVLTSLFVAVTVTPVLCSFLLIKEKQLLKQSNGTLMERGMSKMYRSILTRVLHFPRMILGISLLAFIISMVLFVNMGRSFLPEFNEGSLVISEVGPPSMSLEENKKMGRLIEEILLSFDEIPVVTRRTGRAELDEHTMGVNAAEIDAPFKLKDRTKEDFLAEVREKLSIVPGVNITIGQPIAHRIDHMLSGTRANIAIKVFGHDLGKLFSIGNEISQNIAGVPGLVDVAVEQQIEVPQVSIRPRREMLARYGLTAENFAEFIDVAFAGEQVSQVYEGLRSFDMIVRYEGASRGSLDNMRGALIDLPDGGKIPLEQVADIRSVSSPHTINRENVQRKVVVSANVSDRDLHSVVHEIQQVVGDNITLPEGYRIEYGGQFESEERASTLLLWASVIAVLLIFALLYHEFQDVALSGIVLLNLPLALIGGVFIVDVTSGIISIASTIGFISLFGIATRNGILLISRYRALEEQGKKGLSMILEGSLDRLNPILMTALTTALALIPLALKGGQPGNEIQGPMAVVILGGLLSATVLNLLVVPCVYWLVSRRREG